MLKPEEIKRFIEDDINSEKKQFAKIGQRYYDGDHDIKQCRMFYYNADGKLVEDTTRANIKIPHPFFTELVDQLTSFMFSMVDNPIKVKDGVEDSQTLQKELDLYFDEVFWAEIAELVSGSQVKGFEYIYCLKNAENRLSFECADSMGVVEVRAKDTDDGCKYYIYWYVDRIDKGKKKIKRIQVWDDKLVYFYVQSGNGKIELDDSEKINPRPHVVYKDEETGAATAEALGFIPFWCLPNGRKKVSALKPIKPLIDDYDLHSCSLSNNLKDFDTPLHVVRGFQGNNLNELQQNLKTKKIVGVGEGGGIDVQTVDVPYQARKEKLDIDEKNIYRFGFGLNTLGLKDTAATTNLAIQAAYSLLEMKANKVETALKALLKDILKVVVQEINKANETDYQLSDIEIDLHSQRNMMVNENEKAQIEKLKAETKQIEVNTILNVAATLDDETVLQAICDILDINYEEIKDKVPKADEAAESLFGAKNLLEGIQTDDEKTGAEGSEPLNNGGGNAS